MFFLQIILLLRTNTLKIGKILLHYIFRSKPRRHKREKLGDKLTSFSRTLDQLASESRWFLPEEYQEMREIVQDLKRALEDVNFQPSSEKRRHQLLEFLSQIGSQHPATTKGTFALCSIRGTGSYGRSSTAALLCLGKCDDAMYHVFPPPMHLSFSQYDTVCFVPSIQTCNEIMLQ